MKGWRIFICSITFNCSIGIFWKYCGSLSSWPCISVTFSCSISSRKWKRKSFVAAGKIWQVNFENGTVYAAVPFWRRNSLRLETQDIKTQLQTNFESWELVWAFFSFISQKWKRKPNLPDALRKGSVWKVRTQDPENFDEEVQSLVSAWRTSSSKFAARTLLLTSSP